MTFKAWVDSITGAINGIIVPVIFSLSALAFLYGVYKYFILGAGDVENRVAGRSFVIWGLLGMVVLFSVWSLVNIILSTFGIG